MAEIDKVTQSGTLESSDIMITISPALKNSGISIDLESNVVMQYGDSIRATICQILAEIGVKDIQIKAVDRGALDCTIRARMLTALSRAGITLNGELL